jgi:hypothetical protein
MGNLFLGPGGSHPDHTVQGAAANRAKEPQSSPERGYLFRPMLLRKRRYQTPHEATLLGLQVHDCRAINDAALAQ